jgi:hypothetical protein
VRSTQNHNAFANLLVTSLSHPYLAHPVFLKQTHLSLNSVRPCAILKTDLALLLILHYLATIILSPLPKNSLTITIYLSFHYFFYYTLPAHQYFLNNHLSTGISLHSATRVFPISYKYYLLTISSQLLTSPYLLDTTQAPRQKDFLK